MLLSGVRDTKYWNRIVLRVGISINVGCIMGLHFAVIWHYILDIIWALFLPFYWQKWQRITQKLFYRTFYSFTWWVLPFKSKKKFLIFSLYGPCILKIWNRVWGTKNHMKHIFLLLRYYPQWLSFPKIQSVGVDRIKKILPG